MAHNLVQKSYIVDVKGMLDLKAYLKNPNSANAAQARAQTMVLDSINSLMNGEQCRNQNQTADDPSDLNPNNLSVGLNNRSVAASNAQMSPLTVYSADDSRMMRKSPATLMAVLTPPLLYSLSYSLKLNDRK
jgi:hypothetical protein